VQGFLIELSYWKKDIRARRQRRRSEQLMCDLEEKRGYWRIKEEALDLTLWRTRFGTGYGPVVRETVQ
jgi:hypothetical protein